MLNKITYIGNILVACGLSIFSIIEAITIANASYIDNTKCDIVFNFSFVVGATLLCCFVVYVLYIEHALLIHSSQCAHFLFSDVNKLRSFLNTYKSLAFTYIMLGQFIGAVITLAIYSKINENNNCLEYVILNEELFKFHIAHRILALCFLCAVVLSIVVLSYQCCSDIINKRNNDLQNLRVQNATEMVQLNNSVSDARDSISNTRDSISNTNELTTRAHNSELSHLNNSELDGLEDVKIVKD